MKNNLDQYNVVVKETYFKTVNYSKKLISILEEEPLRQIMERIEGPVKAGVIVHELINALIYIRLECCNDNKLVIHYGYEQSERLTKYYFITSAFIRGVYKFTSKEYTKISIEDCVHTDWVIINCAELFEYVGDRNRYHVIKVLKYKSVTKRKSRILIVT